MGKHEVIEGVEIPVLEISDGWTVDDIRTEDDCDDAFAFLITASATIEYQLEMFALEPDTHRLGARDPSWAPRAKMALRLKKAALQIVQNTRGRLDRKRRQAEQAAFQGTFIEMVRTDDPKRFSIWRDLAIARCRRDATPPLSDLNPDDKG